MTATAGIGETSRPADRRGVVAWALYDWASSAFPTVIVTFVFAAYFTRGVAENETVGTGQWGTALGIAGFIVAILSPLLGAIADHGGRRKPWILAFTALCVVATALLWFVAPSTRWVAYALVAAMLANLGFEFANVFYNALLPELASRERIGRVSGWAWGVGYAGGLACLAVALVVLVQPDPALFGLDRETQEPVRATALLVAVWFGVFSLPLFLWTPDRAGTDEPLARVVRRGLAQLVQTARHAGQYANLARFLVARMIYIDGVNTLFAFGGIYAAGTFGMSFAQILMFGILLNVTAGLGAAAFAWLDDGIGPRRTVLVSLACLAALGAAALIVQSILWFFVIGAALGIFVGPVQAASRSYVAHAAPAALRAEMFGLYALSGRITAFLGPLLVGWVTVASGSQRWGMSTIVVFLVAGFLLLLFWVRDANSPAD